MQAIGRFDDFLTVTITPYNNLTEDGAFFKLILSRLPQKVASSSLREHARAAGPYL